VGGRPRAAREPRRSVGECGKALPGAGHLCRTAVGDEMLAHGAGCSGPRRLGHRRLQTYRGGPSWAISRGAG